MDSGNDAYHDGYQARQQGKSLDVLPQGSNKVYSSAWRTGWFDTDHDMTYTTKEEE